MMTGKRKTIDPAELSAQFAASARPVITVDVEKYEAYLAHAGLDEAQKEEVLQALWTIIVSFVDLGFGVHPLQEIEGPEACGKLVPELDRNDEPDSDGVKCEHKALNEKKEEAPEPR